MPSTTNSPFTVVNTGTISAADAERQQERIKAIMAERRITFERACDAYIDEMLVAPAIVAVAPSMSQRRVPRY